MEADREFVGISTDEYSPRSVVFVHNQILRIREEDSHLMENIIREGFRVIFKDKLFHGVCRRLSSLGSPLGGKVQT